MQSAVVLLHLKHRYAHTAQETMNIVKPFQRVASPEPLLLGLAINLLSLSAQACLSILCEQIL